MHPKVYGAAKLGDFDSLVTIILGNREDLFHQTTPKENNILHIAAQYKQLNLIEHLLRHPSGPSLLLQGNSNGDTPLHIAAALGSCEAVRFFIDLAKSLHWVVENGQVDACKELLRKQNLHKDTALHYAVRGGHKLAVKLLIEEDPHLCDITNAADESPLYLATDREHLDIIKLILGASMLPSSHKGPQGLTALHAAIGRSLTVWGKIMEKRPEVIKERDDMGWTPLHYVASMGIVKAVQLLLQHDTSVAYDLREEGQSALHFAANRGHLNVIDQIVKSCPDAWDLINIAGQTALHVAAISGQVNVVKYILRMPNLEYLINEQDTNGNTALHLAALHKQYKVIYKLAQDKRVDRLASNKDHWTAFDIFYAHGEVGFSAAAVLRVLEGSDGMPHYQDRANGHGKKGLGDQFVEGQPSASTTSGVITPNKENSELAQRRTVELPLILAVLIATVTFAAAFTMPGGYNTDGDNKGMPILADSPSFRLFVVFDSIAFLFSASATFMLIASGFSSDPHSKTKLIVPVIILIYIAFIAMVIAFFSGMTAVSPSGPFTSFWAISIIFRWTITINLLLSRYAGVDPGLRGCPRRKVRDLLVFALGRLLESK